MLKHEPFIRTILERPEDDGPRLVYADWLEEQGECDLSFAFRWAVAKWKAEGATEVSPRNWLDVGLGSREARSAAVGIRLSPHFSGSQRRGEGLLQVASNGLRRTRQSAAAREQVIVA